MMSSPTVGDETRLARPALWVVAVFLPCLVIGSTAALVYAFYKDLPAIAASAPWGALVTVVFGMHLFQPRAPWALRQALVNVFGLYCLAVPLWYAGSLVACFGFTWVFIAMACLVAILVAGVSALWACLARG
ncbi:hypothetical protein C2845_PM03G17840 [Panicum miliaceum]|uniref:DUF7378 domain-containing protein n=1 Tax=Panicum miliaceum TaxID=4540 RepID=A0A3L6TBY2_PANMI|nr:hypothetical protein C2845_PM03G17840 [Panicum miliaceum]